MAHHGIQLYRVVPGANSLAPLVLRFCRDGAGILTCFDDGFLRTLNQLAGGNDEVEVVPFGSLVRRTLEATGEQTALLPTRAQVLAAIGRAVETVEFDSSLQEALRFEGNQEAVGELLTELDLWDIDLLELVKDGTGSPRLDAKLKAVALIKKEASKLLGQLGREFHTDQLKHCLVSQMDPELRLSRILVVIGDEAPPAKVGWIRWMANQGCEVTVVAPRHAVEKRMFEAANHLHEELGCEEIWVGSGNRLTANLFAHQPSQEVAPSVSIVSAANPLAECEWALNWLREHGEADTAIFVRDSETYLPLLEASSEALGVGLALQRRTELLQNGFARLVLDCLEALGGRDLRKLIPILKRSYLIEPSAIREPIEMAIGGVRSRGLEAWDGLLEWTEQGSDETGTTVPNWFKELLEWRRRVQSENLLLGSWMVHLRDLGDILLSEIAGRPDTEYRAERDERAFSVMQSTLSTHGQLEGGSGSPMYSLPRFVAKCGAIWGGADVSVPSSSQGVPVVTSAWSIPPARKLMVLGMLEGVFPRRRRENVILNDRDRAVICNAYPGQRPLVTSGDAAQSDREAFYVLCASGSEELYFSYPKTGDDRDNIPTFYLERVKEAVGRVEILDRSLASATGSGTLDGSVSGTDEPEGIAGQFGEINVPELAVSRDQGHSASAIRDAFVCPFQFQMRRQVKLEPSTRTAAWRRLRSLPFETDLVRATDRSSAEQALLIALVRRVDELSPELNEWEGRLLLGGGERLIREWVQREFCAREIWPRSRFTFGEMAVGGEGLQSTLPGNLRMTSNSIAAVSFRNSCTKVAHLFEASAPEQAFLGESDQLYYGLHLLAAFERGFEAALEVDGMNGWRVMLLLDRGPFPPLINKPAQRVKVLDISGDKQGAGFKKLFFDEVKTSLTKAARVIESGQVQPTPGEHCRWCEYGELCRRSSQYSDIETEPIEA